MSALALVVVASLAGAPSSMASMASMVAVGPAAFTAIDQKDARSQKVARFFLDVTPVTNAQFLAFVTAHEDWRRDRVRRLFAEPAYLSTWAAPLELGDTAPNGPVVEVSWFAASAYCEAQGKRLPSEAEWELAAAASATVKDARTDPAFVDEVLAWYGARPARVPDVGQRAANAWGVKDLHVLAWEWVDDFTSSLAPSDQRGGKDPAFCGTSAGGAADAAAYAAFMRRAFRSSLGGAFALPTLSFRCAADASTARRTR